MRVSNAKARRVGAAGAYRLTRMTSSERDLVTALRNELAGIDPARPCDRLAEAVGLGPDVSEPGAGSRAARRIVFGGRQRSTRPDVAAFDWDDGRRALPDGLATRSVPRARLAEPCRRPDPPRVRRHARRGTGPRDASRGGRAARVLADPAGTGGRDLEERRIRRDVPAPDRRRGRAAGARGAAGLARLARRAQPRAQRGVGEPPARRGGGGTPARRDRPARRRRPPRRSAAMSSASSRTRDARRPRRPSASSPSGSSSIGRRCSEPSNGIERLAEARSRRRSPQAEPLATSSVLWHDSRSCVTSIVAAQLEDAHDPGRCRRAGADDRARGRACPGVTRVICPPFVCLAAVRDALADDDRTSRVGAQNVHHELAGAYTGEVSAPMLAGLATWVIVGHSERRRDAGETDALIGRKLARALDAGLRPILCVGEQLAEREAGRATEVVDGSSRAARRSRPGGAATAGSSSPTSRCGRSGPGATRRGVDAAAMADAIREPRAMGWGSVGRRVPGPLRRKRHVGEHRRVPRRAVDRRRAGRRCLAQARRDGGDRGAGGITARPAAASRLTAIGAGAAGRDRSSWSSSTGSGSAHDPAGDAIAAAPMPAWRSLLEHWPHSDAPGVRGGRRAAARPDGQLRGRAPQPRCGSAGPPGPPAHRRRDRRRVVLRRDRRSWPPATRARGARRAPRVTLIGPGGVHANDRHLVALAQLAARQGVATSPSTRCSTAATRRRRRRSGSCAISRRRLAAAHPAPRSPPSAGATTRWTATSAGSGSSAATTRSSTPRRMPRRLGDGRDRGGVRARRDRRVRGADGHRGVDGRGPRRRTGRPLNFRADRARQLTHALADGVGVRGFDRRRPPAVRPRRPARRDDDRVRGRPAGPRRLPARDRALAGAGVQRGRLAPVPRGGDREIRSRHVLLQRRRRAAVAGGGPAAHPEPEGRDVRPAARDVGGGRHRRARGGDRLRDVRLHRRELRQPRHGRAHRRVGRDDRRADDDRRVPRAASSTRSPTSRRPIPTARARCWPSPRTTAMPTTCGTRSGRRSRRTP